LERIEREIRRAGGEAHAIVADIADKHAIYPLAATAAELVGPIDLLIHNASSLGPVPLRLLLDTECEDLEQVLQVNVIGPFRLSRAIAGSMALRRHGTIAHVSSDAAENAYPRWGAYGLSKAALDHQARLWAAELEPVGVKSFAFDPGEMDTVMHQDAMPDADPSTLAQPEVVAERLLSLLEHDAIESGSRFNLERLFESSTARAGSTTTVAARSDS
jgi:NAD(P)-dependent dehydrogenase (short-subunit alcohol dehydrogenase family)